MKCEVSGCRDIPAAAGKLAMHSSLLNQLEADSELRQEDVPCHRGPPLACMVTVQTQARADTAGKPRFFIAACSRHPSRRTS